MTSTFHPDRRRSLILFAGGILIFGAAAALIPAPGYMDAEYYFATAGELARGRGFTEPFLWNFLAAPSSLPAPSHAYWQPLASLLAAGPLAVLGIDFRVAQGLSVLLAAAIPVLSAQLAVGLGAGGGAAWLAGVLALLPGFFMPYLVTTDTFALFAVIGGLLWWQIGEIAARPTAWRWFLLGSLVALGALARADGLLLWVPAAYAVIAGRRRLRSAALVLAGFGILVAPWWLRNVAATGGPFSPGVGRALWLLSYDDLFSFPPSRLTFARWWNAGPAQILTDRLSAAWTNLQSAVAVNGYVLLLPLMILGGWLHRRGAIVRAGLLYAAVLYFFMSFVFPFAGARGGFFHSSAALMPLLYALAASGLDPAARWFAARLAWDPARTRTMFVAVSLVLATLLSLWALLGKVGAFGAEGSFGGNRATYDIAGRSLLPAGPDPVVAVGDPPGFYLSTGLSAVALPHGDEATLQQVVDQFGVDWIILEADHPVGLDRLYFSPAPQPWLAAPLRFLDLAGRPVYIYRVLSGAG